MSLQWGRSPEGADRSLKAAGWFPGVGLQWGRSPEGADRAVAILLVVSLGCNTAFERY